MSFINYYAKRFYSLLTLFIQGPFVWNKIFKSIRNHFNAFIQNFQNVKKHLLIVLKIKCLNFKLISRADEFWALCCQAGLLRFLYSAKTQTIVFRMKRMSAMSLWFICWSYQHVNSCHCLHGTFIIFPFCWEKMWDSMCFCVRTNNPKQTHIHVMHMHDICWSNKKTSLSEWMKMNWTKKNCVCFGIVF